MSDLQGHKFITALYKASRLAKNKRPLPLLMTDVLEAGGYSSEFFPKLVTDIIITKPNLDDLNPEDFECLELECLESCVEAVEQYLKVLQTTQDLPKTILRLSPNLATGLQVTVEDLTLTYLTKSKIIIPKGITLLITHGLAIPTDCRVKIKVLIGETTAFFNHQMKANETTVAISAPIDISIDANKPLFTLTFSPDEVEKIIF